MPDHWPVAALTRQLDAGDAAQSSWLRADPAHVAPDMGGARMLSHGEALALDCRGHRAVAARAAAAVRRCRFRRWTRRSPPRWYLRLPRESKLPAFAHARRSAGRRPVRAPARRRPGPPLARAAHRSAGGPAQPSLERHARRRWASRRSTRCGSGAAGAAAGLRAHRATARSKATTSCCVRWPHAAGVADTCTRAREDGRCAGRPAPSARPGRCCAHDAVQPLLEAVRKRELQSLTLDFEDGAMFRLRRDQRWRFWREAAGDAVTMAADLARIRRRQ